MRVSAASRISAYRQPPARVERAAQGITRNSAATLREAARAQPEKSEPRMAALRVLARPRALAPEEAPRRTPARKEVPRTARATASAQAAPERVILGVPAEPEERPARAQAERPPRAPATRAAARAARPRAVPTAGARTGRLRAVTAARPAAAATQVLAASLELADYPARAWGARSKAA